MMKPTRTCRNCGDAIFDNGNYTYKLRKSKRIPKKALKAMKSHHTVSSLIDSHHSKFGKFLFQRTHPQNVVEITCGNCDFVFKMNTPKPSEHYHRNGPEPSDKRHAFSDHQPTLSKRKKNKKPKEVNAGLILSPVPFGTSSPSSRNTVSSTSSSDLLVSSSSSPVAASTPKGNFKITAPSSFKQPSNNRNKHKSLESLRKAMLKSKAQSQGASLKDFLSSM